MTRWIKENIGTKLYDQMFDEMLEFMKDGKLVPPAYKVVPLDSFQEALNNTLSSKGFIGLKYYLDLQQ